MSTPVLVDTVIAVVSLAVFGLAYAAARVATRPARVPADPATPDLGDEPPAVVSLFANRWRLNEDASESTLLDLAARGYLELRQPANDPRQTTIHLPTSTPPESDLLPYERNVLLRVRDLAVGGVVPVTALTFRNQQQAKRWNRRLHHQVFNDARERGLSQNRFSPALISAMTAAATLAGIGLGIVWLRMSIRDGDVDPGGAFQVGMLATAVLIGIGSRPHGHRDTPAGRQAAARWLGVRAWLRGHEEFANLPPAAVAVWDRYLPYGAALGVTHTASEILDLGMGNRRLVWSSHGGVWRRVRVRYPRMWRRYGKPVPTLLLPAVLAGLAGAALLYGLGPPTADLPSGLPDLSNFWLLIGDALLPEFLTWLLPVLALPLLGYGGYVLTRTVLDVMTVRTITGEVLWTQVWRSRRTNDKSVPWLDYLAVDDGSQDRTTAWALPREVATGVQDRDVVRIRVRPWSRRVVSLTVVQRAPQTTDSQGPETTDQVAATRLTALGGARGTAASATAASVTTAAGLLTAEEVSQALGIPVHGPQPMPVPGMSSVAAFTTADRNRQVLMVGLASGRYGDWVWRRFTRRPALPGVGEAAHVDGERGAARVGDAIVVLTLLGAGRSRQQHLPWLLHQAAPRLPGLPGHPPRQREPA